MNQVEWTRLSCGSAALFGLLAGLLFLIVLGFLTYNSIDDQVDRFREQLVRAQDQFDQVLENNEEALKIYDEVLAEVEINKGELNRQLADAIERNDDALELYAQLLARAEEADLEFDLLLSEIQGFRSEVALLETESQTLNREIELLQEDMRSLRQMGSDVAAYIEDFLDLASEE